MSLETIFQIPIPSKDPIKYPVGMRVIDKYSTTVYEILEHGKNGVSTLRSVNSGSEAHYNSNNNAYFYPAPYVSLAIQTAML